MIHVCYAVHDRNGKYSKFVGTSIASVFENTAERVTVHILHDQTLSELNRRRLIELARSYDQSVEFHAVELDEDNYKFMDSIVLTPATLYRLKIADVVTAPKAIYLDADTIVDTDIARLWNAIDDEDILGAVLDFGVVRKPGNYKRFPLLVDGTIDRTKYMNGGVLIFNLDRLRAEGNFSSDVLEMFRVRRDEFVDHDQGLLNYCFSERYRVLDDDFNLQVPMTRRMGGGGRGIDRSATTSETASASSSRTNSIDCFGGTSSRLRGSTRGFC